MKQKELDFNQYQNWEGEWSKQLKWWFYNIPIVSHDTVRNKLVDSIVILPEEDIHESGFRCMSLVLFHQKRLIGRVYGGTDAIHIGGIAPQTLASWTVDCLPESGLLNLFILGSAPIRLGVPLSSVEVMPKG